jgi:hypothetical protein
MSIHLLPTHGDAIKAATPDALIVLTHRDADGYDVFDLCVTMPSRRDRTVRGLMAWDAFAMFGSLVGDLSLDRDEIVKVREDLGLTTTDCEIDPACRVDRIIRQGCCHL